MFAYYTYGKYCFIHVNLLWGTFFPAILLTLRWPYWSKSHRLPTGTAAETTLGESKYVSVCLFMYVCVCISGSVSMCIIVWWGTAKGPEPSQSSCATLLVRWSNKDGRYKQHTFDMSVNQCVKDENNTELIKNIFYIYNYWNHNINSCSNIWLN